MSSRRFVAFLCLFFKAIEAIDVATFQSDGAFTTESHMRRRETFASSVDLTDFTVCLRFRVQHLRGQYTYVMSYAFGEEDNALHVDFIRKGKIELELCRFKSRTAECGKLDMTEMKFMEWMHVCTTIETVSSNDTTIVTKVSTYQDGELADEDMPVNDAGDVIPVDGDGVLVLGQDQDSPGGNFDKDQAFSGEISQFGIWKRVLTVEEIQEMAVCNVSTISSGLVVGWTSDLEDEWEISSLVEISSVPLTDLCATPDLLDKFIQTEKISYEKFKPTCDRLGGVIPVVRNQSELYETHRMFFETITALDERRYTHVCHISSVSVKAYIGQTFNLTDHKWYDPYEMEPLLADNSVSGLEALDENEQCAFTWGSSLETVDCSRLLACGVCLLPRNNNRLRLKGLCKENTDVEYEYDIDYYIYGQKNGKPHFRGLMNSEMYFDLETNRWRLQSMRKPHKFLIMENKNPKVLPIGTHNWEIGSDVAACNKDVGAIHELTFSQCTENLYTCSSGECIDLANRCNTELDCADKTDEQYCDYLYFGPNYAKELIPRDEEGHALIVYMNVSVLAFPAIDTVNLKFTTDYFLNLRWYDLRIDFRDLNNITALNSLSETDKDSIWTPNLAFVNALGPYHTVVDEKTSGVLIREDEIPLPEDPTLSTEAMLFSGRSNSILLTREYFLEYSCNFELHYYPFDTQMCSMQFAVQGKTENYVKLEKDGVGIEFLGGRILVEYEIQLEKLEISSRDNISVAEVKIVFRRRMEYHVTNTFLQTLILVGVGFMSLFFDVDNFSDRVMVVLTTMLVIATVQSTIQADLPKTAYYKLIDWWLLFSLNILVVTMIFHTYLSYKCARIDAKEKAIKDEIKKHKLPRFVSAAGTRVGTGESSAVLNGNGVRSIHTDDIDNIDDEDLPDPYKVPKRMNRIVQILYVLIIVIFLIGFWIVALVEYFRPAEEYL